MTAYRSAGVDIDEANRAVRGMAAAVRATHGPRVLSDVGSFGGLFAIDGLGNQPVLVASTDGVGTKVELAARHGSYRSLGHDLVNHCTNDILVQGARPLFFLDYVATARLDSAVIVEVVEGLAEACAAVGAALLGGETAEMPGVYTPGALDIAGTIVGVVERDRVLPRTAELRPGCRLLALPSSGPHTNGYSLIRALLAEQAEAGEEVPAAFIQSLLAPHCSYLAEVEPWLASGAPILGLAHITGGGLVENLPRILPAGLGARVDLGSWTVPDPFATLCRWGRLDPEEAYRVFNMGVGLVVVVPAGVELAGTFAIGEVVAGNGVTLA
jgi:phosphoribosylformylglycinamidine cyclo-ligase